MSEIEAVLERIRAVAFTSGVNKLAARADVDPETARRFLKKPPKQIFTLIALEKAADEIRAEGSEP